MHHITTTLPQFLAFFIGMFALVGTLDWMVRKYGSPRIKALMLSGDDAQGPGGKAP